MISNCWKLYFSREQFCRSIQRLPVSTPKCNVHWSIRGRPLEQQWSIQQLGESNTTAIISHLIELWTIFFTFSSPSSRKSTETRPRLSVITSWSSRFHEVSSCLVIILVIAIVHIYNYVCVLLCLLLYVQRECVVCTECVKGNISRVLFINIHIIYIFCFFLRIFSADQSVILNRPRMCMKLTSTHTCINEKKKSNIHPLYCILHVL